MSALSGIRVVEFADQHGEWCGRLLAGMGADVVKIEPPSGASTRRIGPFAGNDVDVERSLYFWHYNASKRSVVLDIEDPPQRDQLRSMIASADMFIETLAPGRAAELGLDYATLSAENERLIHVAVTPFGQSGAYVDAGYKTTDLVSMALGGPMQSCGYDGEGEPTAPVRPGANHSYHTASHYACIALLAALWEREASDRGQYIDVSAQAALAVTVEFASLYWEYNQGLVLRQTGRHAYPRQTARTQYLCADEKYINLAIPLEPRAWSRLVGFLREQGLGEGLDDGLAQDVGRRLELGSIVYDQLAVVAAKHSADELFHIGQHLGLTWGAVRAPEDWLDDPHAADRQFFADVYQPQIDRKVRTMIQPFRLDGMAGVQRAPLVGEHTDEMLGTA